MSTFLVGISEIVCKLTKYFAKQVHKVAVDDALALVDVNQRAFSCFDKFIFIPLIQENKWSTS